METAIIKYNFSRQLPIHGTLAVIARRGSGKSVLLLDILYRLRDRFDFGLAFTTTTPTAESLARYMPRACVYTDFSVDKIKLLLDEQELLVQKGKPRSVFLLLDDCGFDSKSMNSKPMKELFMNGRHKHITFMCALQSPHSLKPDMRQQLDVVVSLKDNIVANRKRLHEAFYGAISWHNFERLFLAFTAEFGAIIVDQTVQSTDLSNVIYHYKAEIHLPPFICISRSYLKIWNQLKKSSREVARLREKKIDAERRRRIEVAARESGAEPVHVAVRPDPSSRSAGNPTALVVKSLY